MLLRCLNDEGVAAFAADLDSIRQRISEGPQRSLLEDARFTEPFPFGEVDVELREFANREFFASYIDARMAVAGITHTVDVPGMWEWLALFYWEEVCRKKTDGRWSVTGNERYIVNRRAQSRNYRHALRESYLNFRAYRDSGNNEAAVVLSQPLNELSDIVESICARERIKTSPGAMRAATMLFYNQSTGRSHPNKRESGGLRDYCKFIQNLPEEFNLADVSHHTILSMLPPAFDWLIQLSDAAAEVDDLRSEFGPAINAVGKDDDSGWVLNLDHIAAKLDEVAERRYDVRQAAHRDSFFRTGIVAAYDNRCAVSGMGLVHTPDSGAPLYEVQAAHIVPVASGGQDRINNGLALNRTIHWAFDHGMVWIDAGDELRVRVSDEVRSDRRNEWLLTFKERQLRPPSKEIARPSIAALNWHAEHVAGQG